MELGSPGRIIPGDEQMMFENRDQIVHVHVHAYDYVHVTKLE